MKRETIKAELHRRHMEHLQALKCERPDLEWEVAERIIWRRVARDIGMTRVEIARANLNYRDYLSNRSRKKRMHSEVTA